MSTEPQEGRYILNGGNEGWEEPAMASPPQEQRKEPGSTGGHTGREWGLLVPVQHLALGDLRAG